LLRLSRITGARMVACLPQAAPSFRLSCDCYRRLAILIRLDEQTGGSLRYRTTAQPTGLAAAPADRLRATMRENWRNYGSLPRRRLAPESGELVSEGKRRREAT
jgi:hypothetical protein